MRLFRTPKETVLYLVWNANDKKIYWRFRMGLCRYAAHYIWLYSELFCVNVLHEMVFSCVFRIAIEWEKPSFSHESYEQSCLYTSVSISIHNVIINDTNIDVYLWFNRLGSPLPSSTFFSIRVFMIEKFENYIC